MKLESAASTTRWPNAVEVRARNALAVLCVFTLAAITGIAWIVLQTPILPLVAPLTLVSLAVVGIALLSYLRDSGATTGALLLGITYFLVDFTLKQAGNAAASGFDAQSLMKMLMYLVLLAYASLHGARSVFRHRSTGLFLAYAVFALMSAGYSTTRVLALGGGLALLGTALTAATMATWTDRELQRAWIVLFVLAGAILVGSLALYIVAPGFAVATHVAGEGRLRGLTGAPNSLGQIAAMACIGAVYTAKTSEQRALRALAVIGFLLSTGMLLLTGSRTALLGLGASLLLPALMRGAAGLTVLAIVMAGSLVVVAYPDLIHASIAAIAAVFSRTGHAAEIMTFTGRIEIWRACVAIWWAAPWFGYGLGSPRTVIPEAWSFRWGGSTGSAHNFLLESLLSFGVVGTALLLAFIAALSWTTLRNWSQAQGAGRWLPWAALSALLFALTNGLMEKSFAGMLGPNTVVLALVCGTGAALQRRAGAADPRGG